MTNKHVVSGNKKLQFFLHEAANTTGTIEVTKESFLLEIDEFSNLWIPHPNEDVDLGALLFSPIRKHAKDIMKKDIYAIFFDDNLIKTDITLELESDVADEVLMIGYPNGL